MMLFKSSIPSLLRLGLIFMLVAGVLALMDRVYFQDAQKSVCVQADLAEGELCIATVTKEWGQRVVWVDTRHDNDFMTNHLIFPDNRMFRIQPGVKMQAQFDAALTRLFEASEKNECIVVFCKKGCDSASEVAIYLRESGMVDAPVYVLSGGWDALLDAGIATK